MLHHRTDDPAIRAWHIAEGIAEKVYRAGRGYFYQGGVLRLAFGDYDGWSNTLQQEHADGTRELAEAAALAVLDQQLIT